MDAGTEARHYEFGLWEKQPFVDPAALTMAPAENSKEPLGESVMFS